MERETGVEPATLSLGKYESGIAGVNNASQPVGNIQIKVDASSRRSPLEATIRKDFASPLLPDFRPSLTVKEVAAWLRVCTATVYRRCAAGELPYFRVGASIRIRQEDLAAFQAR